ncbi:MAG: beta-lactamase family protein [Pseudomonadota bacterium]|nr:beta-lactamase family protein [Pseudomonadota bacterium]
MAQPSPLSAPDTGAARRADLILASLVEINGVPGMAGSVWKDGETVWTGSAGYADVEAGRRVDDDTVFRMASVSKLFTVMAAGRLQEAGRLDLDAPVRSVLPWLPDVWPDITARQLAAHTAGMPHYQAVDQDRGNVRYGSVREAVAVFQDRALLSQPGQSYAYSSWGYVLLSAEAEAAAQMPFLDYLKAEITPGLGIGPDATDDGDPNASRAYEFVDSRARRAAPHDFSYAWGGGGLSGTAQDVAAWGGRVLDGQIVSRSAFEWMQQPMPLDGGGVASDDDYQVGFGWRVSRDTDGRKLVHHAGVATGARSALVLYPDQRATSAVLSNALWVSSIEGTARMLAAPFLPVARSGPAVPCPVTATRYSGTWGEAAITGGARFALIDGICVGDLAIPAGNPFGDMLNGQPQGDSAILKVVGVEAGDGLGRAALVTPIGVYDLRGDGDGTWRSPLGGGARSLTIRMD